MFKTRAKDEKCFFLSIQRCHIYRDDDLFRCFNSIKQDTGNQWSQNSGHKKDFLMLQYMLNMFERITIVTLI